MGETLCGAGEEYCDDEVTLLSIKVWDHLSLSGGV